MKNNIRALEPVEIKLFGKQPKYYCRRCLKRVYKRNKICLHCFKGIDWKGREIN